MPGAARSGPATRRLHWSALKSRDLGATRTVWNANEEPLEVDLSALGDIFAARAPAKSGKAAKGPEAARDAKVTLIDLKRANNIAITLARFKMPFDQLAVCVSNCDTAAIDLDGYLALLRCLPDEEELAAVLGSGEDKARLGRAEQFFLAVAGIPRVRERVQCIVLTMQFEGQLNQLRTCDFSFFFFGKKYYIYCPLARVYS